jgi:hypothetical protein
MNPITEDQGYDNVVLAEAYTLLGTVIDECGVIVEC